MNAENAAVIRDYAARSLQGTISFPEVVGKLQEIGVERYHADYSRHECTYYFPDGQSLVVPVDHPPHPTGEAFSPEAVEAAVRQSQRGEIRYTEFVRLTMAAGCIGYFVQITGRRALYFGRDGDVHVERFPAAPRP